MGGVGPAAVCLCLRELLCNQRGPALDSRRPWGLGGKGLPPRSLKQQAPKSSKHGFRLFPLKPLPLGVMPTRQGRAVPFLGMLSTLWPSEIPSLPETLGNGNPFVLAVSPSARERPLPPFEGTLILLPISLRLAKPGAMGVCLGDLPRLGALDDHCLLPSPRAFSLQGKQVGVGGGLPVAMGLGVGHGVGCSRPYLSSPSACSFCRVELGPHVRPFFLPPTSSSFFGGPLRPQVPLPLLPLPLLLPPPPSIGVTGPRKATWLLGLGKSDPLGSQLHFPHLGFILHLEAQQILDSNSNHDPSLLEILPQLLTAQDSPAPQSAFKALHVIPS